MGLNLVWQAARWASDRAPYLWNDPIGTMVTAMIINFSALPAYPFIGSWAVGLNLAALAYAVIACGVSIARDAMRTLRRED